MPFNGSGVFQVTTAGQPVVPGTVITSTAFNLLTSDLANGLSTAICKDGQTTTTAAIPFAGGGIKTDTLAPQTAAGPVSLSAGQLKFPAVQNPSSNANTLDDYEEGAWMPIDASGAALSFSNESGLYMKVGRTVFVVANFQYPATADGSTAKVGGLPFTSASLSTVDFFQMQRASNGTLSYLPVDLAATTFGFTTLNGVTARTNTDNSNSLFFINGFYQASS